VTVNSPIGPPSLGMFLREARKVSRVSRERMAFRAGLSTSYLTALEADQRTPSADALNAIVAALGLNAQERIHAFDLAGLVVPEIGAAVVATPEMREVIETVDFAAGYMDETWNVVAVNKRCADAMPGLRDSGNTLRWLFGDPMAHRVLIDWSVVADLAVAWWRGVLAMARDNAAAVALLAALSEYPEFRDRWHRGDVVYDIHEPRLRMRHPVNDERYVLSTWFLTTLDRARPLQMTYLGIPMPYFDLDQPEQGHGRDHATGRAAPPVAIPTLGGCLRALRERAGLSRDLLAARAAVSSSYVAQLETGGKARPSVVTLGALADALSLPPAERHYLFDLASLPTPADRGAIRITPAMWEALHAIGCGLAFLDEHWNVLGLNSRFEAMFPGLRESGNSLRWLFTAPEAKDVLPDWESDTRQTMAMWRATFAAARGDRTTAIALLDELRGHPDFQRVWDEAGVRFHAAQPHLRLRDLATGRIHRLYVVVRRPVLADPRVPLWSIAQPVPDKP
jgi:transcriptional regulator with XRE-family HTH domain